MRRFRELTAIWGEKAEDFKQAESQSACLIMPFNRVELSLIEGFPTLDMVYVSVFQTANI